MATEGVARADGQPAQAHTACVEDRIGDRGIDTRDPELANYLDPGRVDDGIDFVKQDGLNFANFGRDGNVVLREILVDVAALVAVDLGCLMQG